MSRRRRGTFGRALAKALGLAVAQAGAREVHLYAFSDTIPHPGLCALAESANELGGVVRVIGLSKRPGYILIHSHSPTLKFLMLQEVLEYEVSTGRIREDDLVIFADGHDTLLQRPLAELVAAYERWPGSPYLISGERNCWPWPHTHESHGRWDPGMAVDPNTTFRMHRWLQLSAVEFCRAIPDRGPYRYPNIGLSMGPAWRMLEVLRRNNRIVLEEDVNDQGAMWLVILRHAEELEIEIDQRGEVFLSMLQYEGDLEREPCGEDYFAFEATGLQEYCPEGRDLEDEASCKAAALRLGLHWAGAFEGPGDHRRCLHAADARDAAYFNGATEAATGPPNPSYRSLCSARAAPRNAITGAAPAMLHFNGPSHEDEAWPSCYHAWTREFRAVGKSHGFFDVDHNIFLSSDFLCDYSFYRIRDFHAHPLHGGMLEYLKDFYQLPVDPRLLAFRGNVSAIDATRLGREDDLHASSPHLHAALSAGATGRSLGVE